MQKKKLAEYAALAALLLTFLGFYATKVWDIDFWGHLASGRYIVENGSLPSQDPFGIYSSIDAWGQIVLKSQWLGQVLLYEIHHYTGLDGIIAWRACMLAACLLLVYLRSRALDAGLPVSLGVTAITGMLLLSFTGERPQLFSFLYLGIALLLLETFLRTNRRSLLYAIPLLFVLWANTHGAVLFGVVALVLFGMGFLMQARVNGEKFDTPNIRLMAGVVLAGAAASLLAPNGTDTFLTTLKVMILSGDSPLRSRISEYATPWAMRAMLTWYWVLLGLAVVSLYGLRGKQHIRHMLLVVVLGLFSLTGSRYAPLFALAAAPYIALGLERMWRAPQPPHLMTSLATVILSLGFLGYGFSQGKVFQSGMMESKYPVEATEIIKRNNLGGKLFDTLNFGGYLVWNLPTSSVHIFIDGRTLDMTRLDPYTHVLWMTPAGREYFERTQFDMVVMAPGNVFTGESYPLATYLSNHPQWRLIYRNNSSMFFVRG